MNIVGAHMLYLVAYNILKLPVKSRVVLPAMQATPLRFLGREDPLEKDRLPIPVFFRFPCDSVGKESSSNVRNPGWIPGLGRSPEEGKGYPLQYSALENSMGCIVNGFRRESDTTEQL